MKTLEVSEANKLPSLSTWEARRLPLIPHIPHFNFHSKCISLIIKTYLSILKNSFGLLLGMPSGSAIICCTWAFVWVHLFKRQFSSCVFLREIHEMCITGWFSLSGLPCSVLKIRNTIRDEGHRLQYTIYTVYTVKTAFNCFNRACKPMPIYIITEG